MKSLGEWERSLKTGGWPVSPIFKKGFKGDPCNYRFLFLISLMVSCYCLLCFCPPFIFFLAIISFYLLLLSSCPLISSHWYFSLCELGDWKPYLYHFGFAAGKALCCSSSLWLLFCSLMTIQVCFIPHILVGFFFALGQSILLLATSEGTFKLDDRHFLYPHV